MLDPVTAALRLARLGFRVFPCQENKKTPAIRNWQLKASSNPDVVRDLFRNRTRANIGISTTHFKDGLGLLVLDVDNKRSLVGSESLEALEELFSELPRTLTQVTPSGGFHYIFTIPTAVKQTAGKLGKGLDTRSFGGLIVGSGSKIGDKPYSFLDETTPVAPAPQWLIDLTASPQVAEPKVQVVTTGLEINLEQAEARAMEWLYHQSVAGEGQRNDLAYKAACRVKDMGLDRETTKSTLAAYFKCEPPLPLEEIEHAVSSAFQYGQNSPGCASPEAAFTKLEVAKPSLHLVEASESGETVKHPIEMMNEKFAVVNIKGRVKIAILPDLDDSTAELQFCGKDDFELLTGNKTFVAGDGSLQLLNKAWLRSPQRAQFDGVIFEPGVSKSRFLNLWRGFPVKPLEDGEHADQKSVEAYRMLKEHILNNICSKDEAHAGWVWAWIAAIFQKPGVKPKCSLVIRGEKGTGKSFIFEELLSPLLGQYFFKSASQDQILGRFNSQLEGKILVVMEEAVWTGNEKQNSKLKDFITSNTMTVERKGLQLYTTKNLVRYVIVGNAEWIIPASDDEHRYAVFDIGVGRQNDQTFFGQIARDLDPRHLLRELLSTDLTVHNINKAPKTIGLIKQQMQQMDPVRRWWQDSIASGCLAGEPNSPEEWPSEAVPKEDLFTWFMIYSKNHFLGRVLTNVEFFKKLRRFSRSSNFDTRIRLEKGGKPRHAVQFAPLEVCKNDLENHYGGKNIFDE